MFCVKSRTSGQVICNLVDVEEALLAEAAGKQVEAHGRRDVNLLAETRCEQSPDYNRLPDEHERWVKYTTKAGRLMICEVIRLFAPDSEGYPQYLEVVHRGRPDTSFMAAADRCEALDLDAMTPELARALTDGDEDLDQDQPGPKLSKGLRRK